MNELLSDPVDELLSKSLSQIVNEQHQTASVFEKYNLNYCCKGNRSLLQACTENHISSNEVTRELQHIYAIKTNELDFNQIKLYQLADYIVHTHHTYVKKEIPLILSYLEKVSSKHGSQHNELYKISALFADLCNELRHLMLNEETILFPRISQLEKYGFEPKPYDIKYYEYLSIPIIDMEDDHEDASNKMAEIRRLTGNYTPPPDSCTTFKLLFASLKAFEINLHQHVHLENSILFSKALNLQKEIKCSLKINL